MTAIQVAVGLLYRQKVYHFGDYYISVVLYLHFS